MQQVKRKEAIRLLRFLKQPVRELLFFGDIYQRLAILGWRWDTCSWKWIHRSNHPEEIGGKE